MKERGIQTGENTLSPDETREAVMDFIVDVNHAFEVLSQENPAVPNRIPSHQISFADAEGSFFTMTPTRSKKGALPTKVSFTIVSNLGVEKALATNKRHPKIRHTLQPDGLLTKPDKHEDSPLSIELVEKTKGTFFAAYSKHMSLS